MKTTLPILALLSFLQISLIAQDSSRLISSNKQADQTFVQNAALGGLAEIRFGELAQRLGSSQASKKYGEMLFKHHTIANEELKNLIDGKNYTALPTDISGQHQADYARLSRLSGGKFDQAFREQMITKKPSACLDSKQKVDKIQL